MASPTSEPPSPARSSATLARTSAAYLLARGLPALINFSALVLFTRLLAPDAYGRYAATMAGVALLDSVFYQWLRLAVLRFAPSSTGRDPRLLATALRTFLALSGAGGALTALAFWLTGAPLQVVGIATLLLWLQAWSDINLDLLTAGVKPSRYGLLSISKAALILLCGWVLIKLGFGYQGLLLGTVLGQGIALAVLTPPVWRGVRFGEPDAGQLRTLVAYAAPLGISLMLVVVLNTSDRLLVEHFLGPTATGAYAAAYDLVQQSLLILFVTLELSSYPLAVRAYDAGGAQQARLQLRENLGLLLGLALPCTAGLILLARNVADTVLGESFRAPAVPLIPWIVAGTLLFGITAYYVDVSFHLTRHTRDQIWGYGAAALVNVVLNVIFLPRYGLIAAAVVTLVSFAVALAVGWALAARHLPLPFPLADAGRAVVATAVMVACVWPLRDRVGPGALALQVGVGVAVYAAAALALDVAHIRAHLRHRSTSAPA